MIENEVLKCDFCIKSFPDEETLSTHILSIHKSIVEGQKSPFCDIPIKGNSKCDICDKLFSCERGLYRHQKRIHEKRKYPCNFCGKTFTQKKLVNRVAHFLVFQFPVGKREK